MSFKFKEMHIKDVLPLLGISLTQLKELGPSIVGGTPEQWATITEDGNAGPVPVSLLISANELALPLKLAGKPEKVAEIISIFKPSLSKIPEILFKTLNGEDIKYPILTVVDNEYIMWTDPQDESVAAYSITHKDFIPLEQISKMPPPGRSISLCLPIIIFRLLGSSMFEEEGKEAPAPPQNALPGS